MQHLEEGTIHAWLDGALSGDERARVEQHVQQCAECAAMVAEARGIIAGAARIVRALDVVPGGVIRKQRTAAPVSGSLWRSLRLTPFRAALAASLMIAAASLVTVRRNGSTEFDAARADKAEARSAPAPASHLQSSATPAAARAVATPEAPPLAKTKGRAKDARGPIVADAQPRTGANASALAEQMRANPVDKLALSGVVATTQSKKLDSVAAPRVALRDVAATAASPAPAIPPASVATNEARRPAQDMARDAKVADSVRATGGAGARERTTQARMEPSRQLVMTNALSIDAAGCYEVSRDSNAVRSPLPERFVLERSPSERSQRNVIHAIDTGGRLDTAIVGTWRDVNTNVVMVNLTAGNTPLSLTLAKTVTGFTVQPVSSFAPSSPPRIVRTNCPR